MFEVRVFEKVDAGVKKPLSPGYRISGGTSLIVLANRW